MKREDSPRPVQWSTAQTGAADMKSVKNARNFADADSRARRRQAKERLFELVDDIRARNPGTDSDRVLAELQAIDGREGVSPGVAADSEPL